MDLPRGSKWTRYVSVSLGPRLSSSFSSLFRTASAEKLDESLGPRLSLSVLAGHGPAVLLYDLVH